ncbi:MAG TPA: alpha/beta hydrolase [Syntrophorhabdales bacterium]|nr:alpha/beta hydrolase [Syntrophorhabdales bacterium]
MVYLKMFVPCLLCSALLLISAPVRSGDLTPLSISMEGYPYPYPVGFLPLTIEGQGLRMAYMDVPPARQPNGRSVVLMHGKNFFGAYWRETIDVLSKEGYRVVVPDQLGFGRSSRPNIHYSFHLFAANTKKLLDTLGIRQAAIVGHSMGGMVATRFALLYPDTTSALILENPIGLEDYRELVPYISLEEAYQNELKASEEGIRNYIRSYFVTWKPEYEEYADVAIRMRKSGEYPRQALSSALTYQMIYEQPVCHEFPYVSARTLLIIGQSDRTVVGKARMKKELLPVAGNYPELGRKTAKLIPNVTLVEVPNAGHIPRFEFPALYQQELLRFLVKG